MAIESEIKAKLESAEAMCRTLEARGARRHQPRALEDNYVLDDPAQSLHLRGELLRVRITVGGAVLTWKGPKSLENRVKSREEIEVRCGDGRLLLTLLEQLGFRTILRYQKYRETWEMDGVQVMIDETPAGDFVEIEGSPAAVRALQHRLDIDDRSLVEESYPALFLRLLHARGEGPPEMVFRGP